MDEIRPLSIEADEKFKAALDDSSVHRLYANSFILRLTNADLSLVLQNNGKPVAIVSFSYTLAKTLAQRLGMLLSKLESKTRREMLTTDQVDAALQKKDEDGDGNQPH